MYQSFLRRLDWNDFNPQQRESVWSSIYSDAALDLVKRAREVAELHDNFATKR